MCKCIYIYTCIHTIEYTYTCKCVCRWLFTSTEKSQIASLVIRLRTQRAFKTLFNPNPKPHASFRDFDKLSGCPTCMNAEVVDALEQVMAICGKVKRKPIQGLYYPPTIPITTMIRNTTMNVIASTPITNGNV